MADTHHCLPILDALRLAREGTGQGDRYARALDPATAPVLGRTPAETLLYARAYAAKLRYFDATDRHVGDWKAFFAGDVSVHLATAAAQDVTRYREAVRFAAESLLDLTDPGATDLARQYLSFQFAAAAAVATGLDRLASALPGDIPLKATLRGLIAARLSAPLDRLLGYVTADALLPADERLLLDALDALPPDLEVTVLGEAPTSARTLLTASLSSNWTLDGESWTDHLLAIEPDDRVFGDPADGVVARARRCSSHALVRGALDHFLRALSRVTADATLAFDATLTRYAGHSPHYALFLAFVRLFERARTEINGLSKRHLDFYYQKVLRLSERPPVACSAHLTVELAKNVASYELPAGTAFKAGKDAQGNAVVFESTAPLVVNRAQLAAVKRLYRETAADAGTSPPALRADDDALATGESWRPFANTGRVPRLGFAVASHYLYLAEGTRTVTVTASLSGVAAATDVTDGLVCRLTTEEGWLELAPSRGELDGTGSLIVELTVDGDAPAVTAFDAGTHETPYGIDLPVLEILLADGSGSLDLYETLEHAELGSISVAVSVDALRSLTLSTDLGPADPAKPFQPFGPSPVVGSALRLGCQELFRKRGVTSATLDLRWRNLPVSPMSTLPALVTLSRLGGGQWGELGRPEMFRDSSEEIDLTGCVSAFNPEDRNDLTFATPFSLEASSGYLKFALLASLGHDTYAARLATYVAQVAAKETPAEVETPYTPELESVALGYTADQTIGLNEAFDARQARVFHVHAFGVAEQHASLNETVYLLPQLRSAPLPGEAVSATHAGELYLGLSDVVAPQNVALLFQVEDGTADPLTAKPESHLRWNYLRGNQWVAFDDTAVADGSAQLLQSGIVTLAIPEDASTDDSLLPGGLIWIRVAVAKACDAVCTLQAVMTQALQATFVDKGNDPGFLAAPLAAGTIAKLSAPVAQVKSVAQPFPSFGGEVAETPGAYYTRVSERLRHKDRSLALWDFERIVLEHFPSIHRVKCLNHTRYEAGAEASVSYHELAAGHVTLIPIPQVASGSAPDPLKPYTSLSTLEAIRRLLEPRCSPFATLHVCNPIYEEIRVVCRVKYRRGCDESQSKAKLLGAITQFLAPWAYRFDRHPTFGGKVYASALIDFMEEQPDVDYVTDFQLYHDVDGVAGLTSKTLVEGTRAASILAPAPETAHSLETIPETSGTPSAECRA